MLLVIARKFNDIFYAMSLSDWINAEKKILIIISNGIPQKTFPYQDLFDDVIFLQYSGESIKNILLILWKLYNLKIGSAKTIILSNPILVTNQYIIKKANPSNIILIEDGSLNYSIFNRPINILKKILQKTLFINEGVIFSKISCTYLFFPEKGSFFYGELKKLTFRKGIFHFPSQLSFLKKKRLFVGQPLYNYGYLSLSRYNELINQIITKYNIDYYIPHAFSSTSEEIYCNKIALSEYNITLEALASNIDFEIYSLGSSVLYSCKTINPCIKSYLIKTSESGMNSYPLGFVETFCDKIYRL